MVGLFEQEGGSFEAPIEMLITCHDKIRRFAALTAKLAEHLERRGCDDVAQDAARGILRYFDIAAPLHHQDEEDDLFPALLACAEPALRAEILALSAEHLELDALWLRVRAALQLIVGGESGASEGATLPRDLAEEFARRYPQHAAREENDVYPHVGRLLDAATLAGIGARMEKRRQPPVSISGR